MEDSSFQADGLKKITFSIRMGFVVGNIRVASVKYRLSKISKRRHLKLSLKFPVIK